MKTQNDKILNRFLRALRKELGDHLKQVILFGSRAGQDACLDSDYDCMTILDTVSPSLNDIIDEIAGEFLYEYNIVFSVFPVSQDRYQHEIHNPFFMNVRREGISL